MMNGFNLTERTRRVLALAREEAARLRHEYVGTEHILLGLVREGEGCGVTALQRLNVDPGKIRDRIEGVVKPGPPGSTPTAGLPYTSRAKTVLELAMREARSLNHAYVGTEHLLLGMIAEGRGIAAQVLAERGAQLEPVRAEILRILGTEVTPMMPRPDPTAEYERMGAARSKPVDGVDVVLHYQDGQEFKASFEDVYQAREFLLWIASKG